jgi:hypothetical protein
MMRVVERVRIHSLFRELAPEERELEGAFLQTDFCATI